MSEETLRKLIRFLGPLTRLRQDLEQTLHLELHEGVGDMTLRTYEGLRAGIERLMDEPFLAALALSVPDGAGDREKVTQAFLASGQLLAFVQGEVGLTSLGSGTRNIQTAPSIQINTSNSDTTQAVMDVVNRALGHDDDDSA